MHTRWGKGAWQGSRLEPRRGVCRPVDWEEGTLELPVAPGVLGGQGLGEQQAGGTRGDAHTVG